MKHRRIALFALCAAMVVAALLVSPLMPGLWTVLGALLILGIGAAMVVIGRRLGSRN
ncbi:hypothetical protein H9Y04_37450 [Streptomyces sp. TRM66268-LWL]|uniref:Uncharacterized protein n=1 Tax=Streptomyces polyasparticus TaxID=2767826 RepID=A0ABR7SUL7_9ACTN|nr:hypothetical protein [Streptomyces polyasparticus]MBC9718226.1 hypothetical protein [Streptomyces polyasparticus]